MKRIINADRDGLVIALQNERLAALDNAALTDVPRYRRMRWEGRAEGLAFAIKLLQDWTGDEEDEIAAVSP